MKKAITVGVVIVALAGCATMYGATPDDMQQYYAASPEDVETAIRSYMFNNNVMIMDSGDGWIRGQYENASTAINIALGTNVVSRVSFNYQPSGGGTMVRSSIFTDASNTTVDASVEVYRSMFSEIGDILDAQ